MRWLAAVVLLVLAGILVAILPVALFAHNQVFNGDRYVATVAPLAADPEIQSAVADRVATEVVNQIDVPGLTQQMVDALDRTRLGALAGALGGALNGSVESFVEKEAYRLVQSAQFQTLWTEANRAAHEIVLRALTSGSGTDAITVDLGRILDAVKQRLLDKGFTTAERIPQKSVSFTVVEVPGLAKAQQYVRWLNTVATWLPWIALVLLAAGLLLAPARLKALLVFTATTVVLTMVLLSGSQVLKRRLPGDTAREAYDIVSDNLITALRVVLAIAALATIGLLWASYHHRAKQPVM